MDQVKMTAQEKIKTSAAAQAQPLRAQALYDLARAQAPAHASRDKKSEAADAPAK